MNLEYDPDEQSLLSQAADVFASAATHAEGDAVLLLERKAAEHWLRTGSIERGVRSLLSPVSGGTASGSRGQSPIPHTDPALRLRSD